MIATHRPLDLPRQARPTAPARPSVALVNDDAAVRMSLKFLFEAAGFGVRAYTGERGLMASTPARAAECFVLDHRPRGLNGLALGRRLRKLGLGAPIVVTTGFPCAALEILAKAIDRVIVTPSIDEALIQRLLKMIDFERSLRTTT